VLSPGKLRLAYPDGKSHEMEMKKAGEVLWSKAETHAASNVGGTEFRGLVVEFRDPPRTAEAPATLARAVEQGRHVLLAPDDLRWEAGPPSLPRGAEMAVLEGDPKKTGPFTMRVRVPAGYKIAPHWHPANEHVTVMSGTLHIGMGDEFNESAAHTLPAGGFAKMPAGVHHFAWMDEPTVVQIHAVGPWAINYLNPADEPRTKAEGR
jgi:quercetin dioxygenase-like cupin family protein